MIELLLKDIRIIRPPLDTVGHILRRLTKIFAGCTAAGGGQGLANRYDRQTRRTRGIRNRQHPG